MKKVIILTGNELRHEFFRKYIASSNEITVLRSYCEVPDVSLLGSVAVENDSDLRTQHLQVREQVERDFFSSFCLRVNDASSPKFIPKGSVNSNEIVDEISEYDPDLIISYGCSIIKSSLLEKFTGRFLNIHLGLSPYYRGVATNLFPFVNDEVSCVGVTFMHIDEGIDTGKIIHQVRPSISYGDSVHQIGNRLISEMTVVCEKIICRFDTLEDMKPVTFDASKEKVYRKKDFTEEITAKVYQKFADGIIEKYIKNKEKLDAAYPIVQNSNLF